MIGDPESRFETAATAISASATIVSDHSIQILSIRRLIPARSLFRQIGSRSSWVTKAPSPTRLGTAFGEPGLRVLQLPDLEPLVLAGQQDERPASRVGSSPRR